MKTTPAQKYEDYWKITLEYSDIDGERFRGTLKIIVNFIDNNRRKQFSSDLFNELQEAVYKVYPKEDMASVRKSINQFVKLGFIKRINSNFIEIYDKEFIKQIYLKLNERLDELDKLDRNLY